LHRRRILLDVLAGFCYWSGRHGLLRLLSVQRVKQVQSGKQLPIR
jgi:hypothetical protein